ncbi:gfo/Idh/MocA family oxidoreductase [Streptomyces radicis]|uniref:Gfo/Idh/MocA family oxidoreductase n=1 Tax=Streptomyces radicis TaxID=1750517 RepID=A0A3A9W4T3_9ACTN|nr:gfo/Idh/MocA family oxidoreductase [Streptomyces radicis]RKN19624.1 gfo/Idh/MocA family oxidoreductase [Streptomyces radicis]
MALVGLGWAGRSIWLPRLREHPAYTVTAVADPDPAARAAAVAAHAGARALAGVAELTPEVADLAVVAVPNHLHAPVAAELLGRGIPVFVEKPVCLTSAEADLLAAAERAGGAVLLAGSAARYRADVRALHALAGDLGTVRHIEAAWVRASGVPDAGGWFTDLRRAGGGALLDLGWHLLDSIGPLLGEAVFEQVAGTVSDDFVSSGSRQAAWRRDGAPGGPAAANVAGDVEDTARGFLVTGDGVSVSLRASWASHEARDVTLIRVEGSAGTATLRCTFGFSPNRQERSELTRTRDGETRPVAVPDEPVGAEYLGQLDALPALLADPSFRGRAVADARRAIGVIEGLYTSARTSRARRAPGPAVPAEV